MNSLESEYALPHRAPPPRLEAEDVVVGAVPPQTLERPRVLPGGDGGSGGSIRSLLCTTINQSINISINIFSFRG